MPMATANDVSIRMGPQDSSLAPALVAPSQSADVVQFPDLLTKQIARVRTGAAQRASGKPRPASGGEEASAVAIGVNRPGASRPVDVSGSESALDSGIKEPASLRKLREALVSTASNMAVVASSPRGGSEPSTRVDLNLEEGTLLAVWISTLTFGTAQGDAKSLLVMVVEDRLGEEIPEMLVFDLRQDLEVSQERLTANARIFWTRDEERDEDADERDLVGVWTAQRFADGGEALVVQELLQYVALAELGSVDRLETPQAAPASARAIEAGTVEPSNQAD